MRTSHGRYCRRCRNRVSRKTRLCHICGALNFKLLDYALIVVLSVAAVYVLWRWL